METEIQDSENSLAFLWFWGEVQGRFGALLVDYRRNLCYSTLPYIMSNAILHDFTLFWRSLTELFIP